MAERRFVVAGTFIDGSGADVRRGVFLEVTNGSISSIGPAADLPSAGGAVIDDFSHCIILPALFDCSVSLSRLPSVDGRARASFEKATPAQKAAIVGQHILYCHMHGLLGVADCDDMTNLVKGYQDEATQGGLIDVCTSGRLYRSMEDCADGNAADNDYLKIAYSNSVESEDLSPFRLDYADLCRLLEHRGQKKAVVVANGRQMVDEAVEAGCDAIEQGYGMGEDTLRKMADKNVLWIPSLLRAKNALDGSCAGGTVCCRFSHRYVAPGKPRPGAEAFWKKRLSEQLTKLQYARKIGVRTAIGTGAGSAGILHGESIVEEMKLFVRAGYSLEETIRCASETGARFFGVEKLGMLAVGRSATFLVARGTIPQLPRKLSYLEGIFVDGKPSSTYRKNPVKTL
nr:amidohydrolase family protein [Desulfobulbaceae bacterium]